jgi:predicted GNAT family acetyltransferase
MTVRIVESTQGIDWARAKRDLAEDRFDNGRSAAALQRAFEASAHVAFALDGDRVVGMARLLSDGVSNAYLVDVWTQSSYRRRGVATSMIRSLASRVPGQHIALQTDDAAALYRSLGFEPESGYFALVVGRWLDNDANREAAESD